MYPSKSICGLSGTLVFTLYLNLLLVKGIDSGSNQTNFRLQIPIFDLWFNMFLELDIDKMINCSVLGWNSLVPVDILQLTEQRVNETNKM